jgi:hypothetical protein
MALKACLCVLSDFVGLLQDPVHLLSPWQAGNSILNTTDDVFLGQHSGACGIVEANCNVQQLQTLKLITLPGFTVQGHL